MFVLLTCYGLTVLFDMVTAVSVGVVLAAILFMRRMAELTEGRTMLESEGESGDIKLPAEVGLYEINGPLFFGAAQNAMGAIHAARGDRFEVMILHLGKVPVIDGTGLVALDNAIGTLTRAKKTVVLAGPLPRPRSIFEKARLEAEARGASHGADPRRRDRARRKARERAAIGPIGAAALEVARYRLRAGGGKVSFFGGQLTAGIGKAGRARR